MTSVEYRNLWQDLSFAYDVINRFNNPNLVDASWSQRLTTRVDLIDVTWKDGVTEQLEFTPRNLSDKKITQPINPALARKLYQDRKLI